MVRTLLLVLLAALSASAAEPRRLAVLEFEVSQGLKIDRTYFSDLARGAVHRRAPEVFVMTRESTEVLLNAAGKTLADCTGECEVEVGRKLGADFIVSGRVAQIGSWITLTLRLFAAADGRLVETVEARGRNEDELLEQADQALATLAGPLSAISAPAPAQTGRAAPASVSIPVPEAVLLPSPQAPRTPGHRNAWLAIGLGALVAGGSAAFDNLSSTSKDGRLTAVDFLPVAGYAVALALGGWGAWQAVQP
jgi:TolB-like protein